MADHRETADPEFERRLVAFEEAWLSGSTPDLGGFLSPAVDPAENGSSARRARHLVDLVSLDLEYRWKALAPESSASIPPRPRLDHYLNRYPELGTRSSPPLELVGAEYYARTLWGDRPDESDYLSRFPEIAPVIRDELRRIDDEIAREGPVYRPATRPDGQDTIEATKSINLNGSWPSIDGLEWLGVIGRGSMGIVYKARDVSLGRIVAIKTIAQGQHAALEQRNRFQAEARAVARLRHPNIIAIHQIGEHGSQPYLSLEFADGGDLDERLAEKPTGPREAAELTETLARAMHAVHEAGVLHRDLKPRNVLITSDGVPKISDFGLAKLLDAGSECTASGQVMGTPSYMAPEQAEGHSKKIGPAADIYALGAILYKALTGRPPFLGSTALETLKLVSTTEVARPAQLRPDVPNDLETICLKCLQKEPSKRYASALDLADDLRRFLDGRSIAARPVGPAERFFRWCRRNPRLAAAWMLVVATVLGAISVYVGQTYRHNRALRAEVRRTEAKATEAHLGYLEARSAMHAMLGRLDDRQLDRVPELLKLRRGLLEDFLSFFDRMLAQIGTNDLDVRADAARAASELSVVQVELGHPDQAEKLARRAVELLTSLRKAGLDDRGTLMAQSEALMRLGSYLVTMGKPTEAIAFSQESVEVMDTLIARGPPEMVLEEQKALFHQNHGNSFLALGKKLEAIDQYETAIRIREGFPRKFPGLTQRLAQCYINIGHVRAGRREQALAEQAFHQAEKLLLSQGPDVRMPGETLEMALGTLYVNWSGMLQDSQRSEAAIQKADLGITPMERHLHLEPKDAGARRICLGLHGNKAYALSSQGKHAESAREWAQVIELCDGKVPLEYHIRIAIELAQAGELDTAKSHADLVTSIAGVPGVDCHDLGNLYSLWAARVRDDQTRPTEGRSAVVASGISQALRWLKAAQAAGLYKAVPSLRDQSRNDRDFAIVRDRPEFGEIFGKDSATP
jgi:serine/threonine-protein kinase